MVCKILFLKLVICIERIFITNLDEHKCKCNFIKTLDLLCALIASFSQFLCIKKSWFVTFSRLTMVLMKFITNVFLFTFQVSASITHHCPGNCCEITTEMLSVLILKKLSAVFCPGLLERLYFSEKCCYLHFKSNYQTFILRSL